MRAHNTPILNASQLAQACKLAKAGATLRQLSARYGVSHETIRRHIRRAGLTPGTRTTTTEWSETQ